MNKTKVNVAVIQSSPVVFNLEETLEKVSDLTAKARQKGVELVVFPEAFISGYPKGFDFGVKLGYRRPEGREEFKLYANSAVIIPSSSIDYLSNVAEENNVYLVTGVIEREDNTLYCSVLFFAPDGSYLGKHRKLVPTAMERVVWGCGDGSTMPVYDTEIGNLGAVICWENYMPLLRTHMYSKNIQIYCAATVDDREEWISTMKHIALEGRCFVLSACQFLTKNDLPKGEALNIDKDILIRGGSCIIDPLGQVLAGPVYDEECILTAEIDLNDIIRGKYDLDVVGHYARPDIFQLIVNEKSMRTVTTR